ncbi:MAG: amidase [Microbacteriaceae bacterium]|nr:amidase [Microbacteriaceae bacterium]
MSPASSVVTDSNLAFIDATTATAAFRSGELAPSELLAAVAQRIRADAETEHRPVNAFTETMLDEAAGHAAAADAAYARAKREGAPTPPLLGIPVATKEKHGIAGRLLEQGLLACRGERADRNHPVVDRILAAGGIIHGRTTSPEFSCATVTHSALWGVTRNPWNTDASPGGSSGGAGAALAAGMATLATASDIAGSTRIPAAFTGTVGYKAPYGRIPGVPPLSADWYRGDGPMGRSVADTALLASIMSGRDPLDHTSWGAQGALERADGDLRGLRIGLSMTLGDYPVASSIRTSTERVAAALERAGAEIVPVRLPWTTERISAISFAHFGQILGPAMARLTAGHEDALAAYTRDFIATAAEAASRTTMLDSIELDTELQLELATAMSGLDALLAPTQAMEMLEADGDYLDGLELVDADGAIRRLDHYWQGHMTSPFNIANRCPVLSVPSGISSVGVPTGVQIVGHPFDEAMVFRIGAAVERLVDMPKFPGMT